MCHVGAETTRWEHLRKCRVFNIALVGLRDDPYPYEQFVMNKIRSRDSCLTNSEDMLIKMAWEDGEKVCSRAPIVEDGYAVVQSEDDPFSFYLRCKESDGSMLNRGKLKKGHFQENSQKSELSLRNTVGEEHCLKGFTLKATPQDEPASVAFLKRRGVQSSQSDDLIFGFLNIQNRRQAMLEDHMIIFLIIGCILYFDPALLDGDQRQVVFPTMRALSEYHYSLGHHHYFGPTLQSLTFWPMHQRCTIRNYELRHLTSKPPPSYIKELCPNSSIDAPFSTIWPYTDGSRNAHIG